MNLKQYWKFFKIAVALVYDPNGYAVTDDLKVSEVAQRKFPKAKILYMRPPTK